ncbi:MAG: DUF1801 domain-containing protein [Bacteroidota bacterium]
MVKANSNKEVSSDRQITSKSVKKKAGTSKTNASTSNKTEEVDLFMRNLVHPLKDEIEAVRSIIKNANDNIKEQVKWNAPSFFFREDLVTFNPRLQTAVHLVFHHPNIVKIQSPLLEGNYKDRRMMYLENMEKIKTNKIGIETIINSLVQMMTL